MTAVPVGVRSFDIGRVIQRTFSVAGRNFVAFYLLTVLLSSLPNVIATTVFQVRPGGLPSLTSVLVGGAIGMIGFITSLLVQGALVWGTIEDLNGRKPALGELLSHGLNRALPILGISLLFGMAAGFGFVLFVVPGLILLTMWAVVVPVTVVERPPGLGAFGRSAALTRGSRWAIFGLALVYLIVAGIVSSVAKVMALVGMSTFGSVVIISLINAATVMVGAVGGAVLYAELRASKEGIEPDALASVFD